MEGKSWIMDVGRELDVGQELDDGHDLDRL